MFGARKNIEDESPQISTPSFISKGMIILGDVSCSGDVKVDGHITGNITTSGRIVIGSEGKILGTIMGSTIVVQGTVDGRIECAGPLSLKDKACVIGDVVYDTLEVDFGVELKGNLSRLEIQKIKLKIEENSKSWENLKEDKGRLLVIKNNSEFKNDSGEDWKKKREINEKYDWT